MKMKKRLRLPALLLLHVSWSCGVHAMHVSVRQVARVNVPGM